MSGSVLIPVDGSSLAEKVLGPARPLIEALEADVVLLRVVPTRGTLADVEVEADEAGAALQRLQDRLGREGLRCQAKLVRGDPAEQILTFARALRPDYLAMATHGRSGVSRLVRGSTAERVLRHATAPVLLCNPHVLAGPDEPPAGPPFRRILVPLDGSDLAAEVLPHVERLARVYGSEVLLLTVEPYEYTLAPTPLVAPPTDPRALEALVEGPRARLAAAGIPTSVMTAHGVVPVEVLRAAHACDLVAMTTHGRGGASRWWFGSVAEQVLRHCAAPLLVLRVATPHDEA
ncbi:MAG: universal stress protein [Planctomycetes bacterium]|nr:universal stress protein [Planctomycetota bacterium]